MPGIVSEQDLFGTPDLAKLINRTDGNAFHYNFGARVAIDGDVVAVLSPDEPAPFKTRALAFWRWRALSVGGVQVSTGRTVPVART